LPATELLDWQGDLSTKLVAGADKFLDRQTALAAQVRAARWKRDFSSLVAYRASVAPQRELLQKRLGVVDARTKFAGFEIVRSSRESEQIDPFEQAQRCRFHVDYVRWPVFRGVTGEGLLLTPISKVGSPRARPCAIVLPDADWTPEMVAGTQPGLAPQEQLARRLAENGVVVLVPFLIDRQDTYSVVREGRATNQPHREFVYRGAFEMGRHVLGYELQKISAALDELASAASSERSNPEEPRRIAVVGYGEGGLLALLAGAIDERIHVVGVSGAFDVRDNLWSEPIYRNLFGFVTDFGDAELATLIYPRTVIVEASDFPRVDGPPAPREGRAGAAPGRLRTPPVEVVAAELKRAETLLTGAPEPPDFKLVATEAGKGRPGSPAFLSAVLQGLGSQIPLAAVGPDPVPRASSLTEDRAQRQTWQLVEDVQQLWRMSESTRQKFWSKADPKTPETWQKSITPYREYFAKEVIGQFDEPVLPPRPRVREIYDEPKFKGYEVVLDVWPEVYTYGILLVPKGIAPGERRPVVVCQHGLEGRPQDLADPKVDHPAYHRFACALAERGFVTFAPQNIYLGKDQFRVLQRKANPLGKTLFSLIVPQHQVAVQWLATIPFVDSQRIAFYGLSYGGKSAMRIPPLVDGYCLSICSADFNEWIWKNIYAQGRYTYLGTGEYEIFEWDLGNTFNYAEMAGLIAPRPFMVERGHHDGVAPDEMVAYEYAKVRRLFALWNLGERTELEFFNGPHTIHGVGTFEFLHRHLNWPRPGEAAR